MNAQLAERAQEHYEALLLEYSVQEATAAALDAAKAGVDGTILVKNGLKRALERAARDTAAALRSAKL